MTALRPLGTVLRACGHGFRVGILQFIKGSWKTGEQTALTRSPIKVSARKRHRVLTVARRPASLYRGC